MSSLISLVYLVIGLTMVLFFVSVMTKGLALDYGVIDPEPYKTTLNFNELNKVFDRTKAGLTRFFLNQVSLIQDPPITYNIQNYSIDWQSGKVNAVLSDGSKVVYSLEDPVQAQFLFELFLSFK